MNQIEAAKQYLAQTAGATIIHTLPVEGKDEVVLVSSTGISYTCFTATGQILITGIIRNADQALIPVNYVDTVEVITAQFEDWLYSKGETAGPHYIKEYVSMRINKLVSHKMVPGDQVRLMLSNILTFEREQLKAYALHGGAN